MVHTRYTFGKGGTVFATKVVPGGTIIATKNVPPGTIFARYNYCVTVPTVPKLVPRGVINTNLKGTNKALRCILLRMYMYTAVSYPDPTTKAYRIMYVYEQ